MTSISLHPTPRWSDVAREQMRAVELGLRREATLFLGLLTIFAVLGISTAIRHAGSANYHGNSSYDPVAAIPIVLFALLIPLGVWREEGPARRAYHWVMPVGRIPHALAKLLSGWIWVMAAVAIYVLYVAWLTTLINAIVHAGPPRHVVPGWQWAIPFTAGTVAYLLGSAAVIGSNHPIRWIGGLWIVYWMVIGSLESFGMMEARRVLLSILSGRYGMWVVLMGNGYGMGTWVIATLLWGAIAAVLLGIALHRRPEG